jgi:UDP-2,4-diacetamido-2,4,6-trideoxy-beta-L-altropyranose hydrolase
MRCLTLAEGLRRGGGQVAFACRDVPGNLCGHIEDRGFKLFHLAGSAGDETLGSWHVDAEQMLPILSSGTAYDWLVVDHYELDSRWESAMRPHVGRVMAIDDLADRPHDCDVLLDQNYYKALEVRYDDLVPEHCLKLLGPAYALLRAEFLAVRRQLRHRDGSVSRVLVFLGGSDSENITSRVIEAIFLTGRHEIALDVVIGSTNPHREQIAAQCDRRGNATLHVQAGNMATLMALADLSIGAGGATTWERCYLGLPTLTVVFAANQERTTTDLADIGAIRYLGWADQICSADLVAAIKYAISHPAENAEMGIRARKLMKDLSQSQHLPAVDAILRQPDINSTCNPNLPVVQ